MDEQQKESQKMVMLDRWIKVLIPGDPKDFIQEISGCSMEGKLYRKFVLYTEENQYFIVAKDKIHNEGYLGCQVEARKPRPGEDWLRGSDLPDGPFDKNTWDKIINSIVRRELVKLTKYLKPKDGIEDIK